MYVKIKRIQKHTVIHTDEYKMTKEEFFKNYKSKTDFLNDPFSGDVLMNYKVNTIVDEISNREGTYDEDWEYEWFED